MGSLRATTLPSLVPRRCPSASWSRLICTGYPRFQITAPLLLREVSWQPASHNPPQCSCGHRILQGAKPSDLPVEHRTEFRLIVNLKTARSLGIELPLILIAGADEVME